MSYFKFIRVRSDAKSGQSKVFIFPFSEGNDSSKVKSVKAGCGSCTRTKTHSTHIEVIYSADTLGSSETIKGFNKVVVVEFKDGTTERLYFEGSITR